MRIPKVRLSPISLIVPSLLALSAMASWDQTITQSGTGFSAWVTSNGDTGYANAKYDRKNYGVNIHATGGYEDSTGKWYTLIDSYVYTDYAWVQSYATYPTDLACWSEVTDYRGSAGTAAATAYWHY